MKLKTLILFTLLIPALTLAQSTTYQQDQVLDVAAGTYGVMAMCDGGTTAEAVACDSDGHPQVDVLAIIPGTGATSLGKAEDATHTSGDTGVEVLGVYKATPTGMCSDGEYCPLTVSGKGALNVNIWSSSAESLATNILKAEDSAAASGDAIVAVGAVHQVAPNASVNVGTAGDYGVLGANLTTGALYTDPVGNTTTVCVAITPDDDAAYTANDVVATEDATDPLSFASVFRTNVNSGTLNSIQITNTEADAVGWRVVLFDADPSASTTTDGSGLTVADADLTKIVGQVSVADCTSYADNELCQATGVGLAIDGAATGIYAALITPGTPQWAAAQTVNVCLTFVQD